MKNEINSLKNIKVSDYYKTNVLNRALERTKKQEKKKIFIQPKFNYLYAAAAAVVIIFLFSTIDINKNILEYDSSIIASEVNSKIAYEYLSEVNAQSHYELTDYYENMTEEDLLEVLEEMDDVFNYNSSYLMENIAGNTEF